MRNLNHDADRFSPKKTVYVLLCMIFGQLLGFFAFEAFASIFIKLREMQGRLIDFSYVYNLIFIPLPQYVFWLFIAGGAIGGFFLGLAWWRMIYVEHRRWKDWHGKDC